MLTRAHARTLLCYTGLWVSGHVCQLNRKEVWWRGLGVAWSMGMREGPKDVTVDGHPMADHVAPRGVPSLSVGFTISPPGSVEMFPAGSMLSQSCSACSVPSSEPGTAGGTQSSEV